MSTHEVTVGNIGTVYSGTSEAESVEAFSEYVSQSVAEYGRAADESVQRWIDGEIADEHMGSIPSN